MGKLNRRGMHCDPKLTITSDAMDKLGLKRYCCRRMVMTHVDLIEKLLKYAHLALNLLKARMVSRLITNALQVQPSRPRREESCHGRPVNFYFSRRYTRENKDGGAVNSRGGKAFRALGEHTVTDKTKSER